MGIVLRPMLALDAFDLLLQVLITLVVVAIYHVWTTSRVTTAPVQHREVEKQARPQPASVPAPAAAPVIAVAAIPQPAVAKTAPVESFPAEIAAVIAAAIAVVLDTPHRVLSIQPAYASPPHLNVWAFEGRTEIFQSHRIR